MSVLYYCTVCWRMVCKSCYSPSLAMCKSCATKTFNAAEQEHPAGGSPDKVEVSFLNARLDEDKCQECDHKLIITADGTKCCPKCGLVEGAGYSWFGPNFSTKEDDMWHQYENLYEKWIERNEKIRRRE
ncbi:MAG: hypothetical protein QXH91_03560 [Candidatus Bathyarchaeia archaeon]